MCVSTAGTLRFLRPIPKLDQRYTGQMNGQEVAGTFDQGGKGSYVWKMWRGEGEGAKVNAPSTVKQLNMLGEWDHVGNGQRAKLIVNKQQGNAFSGVMYGDPLINGIVDGNKVTFTRDIPQRQDY
jgi:hypothetical protein